MELLPQWERYCQYRDQTPLSDDQLLTVLEDRKVKSATNQKPTKQQKVCEHIKGQMTHSFNLYAMYILRCHYYVCIGFRTEKNFVLLKKILKTK